MPAEGKNILLIYKTDITHRIVIATLRKIGFTKFIEVNGRSNALANLMAGGINLIVSDQSCEIDGIEILKSWEGNEKFQPIPFVIISKEGKADVILAAGKAGVDEYILIPPCLSASEQKEFIQAVHKKLEKFL
jgi:CheY-like chemotaxis protein